jgi:hypothetical protein
MKCGQCGKSNPSQFATQPKRKEEMERFVELKPPNDKMVAIVMAGAMNPIHSGHVSMLETAIKGLEQSGFVVVGTFLRPGHFSSINRKLGTEVQNPCLRIIVWPCVKCWQASARRSSTLTVSRHACQRRSVIVFAIGDCRHY